MEGFTKSTFNLPTEDLTDLKALAKKRHTSVTMVLRGAIDRFILIDRRRAKVLFEKPNGEIREVIIT